MVLLRRVRPEPHPRAWSTRSRIWRRIAADRDIGFHVDSCVGGFFLPFVEKLASHSRGSTSGCPGVTTISADLHKFGYAAKGASLIMSRDRDVFEHQPFRFGGGSRPTTGT